MIEFHRIGPSFVEHLIDAVPTNTQRARIATRQAPAHLHAVRARLDEVAPC